MRLLLAAVVLALSLPATAGVVVSREFDSPALQRKWSYAVYLPDGYDTSKLRYPVLYLLHGHGGGLYDWVNLGHIQQTADALIARGDVPPAIIVMPDADATWYVDRKEKMSKVLSKMEMQKHLMVTQSFRQLNNHRAKASASELKQRPKTAPPCTSGLAFASGN